MYHWFTFLTFVQSRNLSRVDFERGQFADITRVYKKSISRRRGKDGCRHMTLLPTETQLIIVSTTKGQLKLKITSSIFAFPNRVLVNLAPNQI